MATYIDLDSIWRDRAAYPNPCAYELTPNQIETWSRSTRETRPLPANPNERPLDFVNSVSLITLTLPYPRIEIYATRTISVDSILANTLTTLDPHNLVVGDILMTSSPGYSSSTGILRNVEYHVISTATPTTFQISLVSAGPALALTDGTSLDMLLAVLTAADYDTVIGNLDDAIKLVTFPRLYVDFHSRKYPDTRMINTNGGRLADAKFVIGIDRVQLDDKLTPTWIHYKSHGEQVFRFKRDDPVVLNIFTRDGTTINFFNEGDLSIPTNPMKQSLATFMIIPFVKDARFINGQLDPIA